MGSDDNSNLGIQQRGESFLNCSSSGIYTNPPSVKIVKNNVLNSMSLCESSSGVESFFGTGWDPILSLAHNGEFTGTSMASQNHPNQNSLCPYGVYENQGVSSTSQIVQYPNNPRLVDLTPKFPTFGSRNYSEMVSSVTLPEETQMINGGPSTFNKEGIAANSRNSSPDGKKRKRLPDHHTGKTHHSEFNCNENEAEEDQQKDISDGTLNSNEENENISKSGKIVTVISRANQNGKQAKDSSPDGQDPKEDYIHIRAKRGQATNSHSLAERVRREKISERMKLLQDLVPGCNKITGKAVMLDEIINYVQSLQQQVEFLSMKLATVNPELNFNIDQILSKDVLHSRALGSSILGFAPGVTSTFPFPVTNQHAAMQAMQCTDSQAPNTWHDELQTMIQMGFITNQVLDSMGLNGHTKAEL